MRNKIVFILALIFCMSAFYVSASASIMVNAELLDGETIRIDVNDNGAISSLAVNLIEYISQIDSNNPYISIQAINLDGNQSETVQIRNPMHTPIAGGIPITGGTSKEGEPVITINSENQNNIGLRPFTPSGTGTVIDNATGNDGKEFFTIFTEDDNEFFLIIDRQRHQDNVYLLNAVTEQDLMSLVRRSGNQISGIPVVTQPSTSDEEPDEQEQDAPAPQSGGNSGTMIFILFAAIAVGGAGYYLKVVRPKQDKNADDDDFDDEGGENDEDYDDEEYEDDFWNDTESDDNDQNSDIETESNEDGENNTDEGSGEE